MSSTEEVACTYACLILHDDGITITMNIGSGGSVAFTGAVATVAPTAVEDAPAAAEKKEEAKEESDDESIFSLFD
uniref:60S acidic ribosomal protein P1-like n=1 Tax=Solanum lycopersicum TaxID=4081 RepID=A0A3Q7EWT4_SOLLC